MRNIFNPDFQEINKHALDTVFEEITMKLIEPGPIVTDFYGRSRQFIKPDNTNAYDAFIAKFNVAAAKVMKEAEGPEVVAKMIYKSATDNSNQMRYAVGKPGPMLLVS